MASTISLPVVFSTQTAYPLPTQKYMIPASWKRFQLSQLVNKALSLPNPVPFDFLVKGEILTASLGEWCAENGAGEEETLDIEYIESVLPPQKMSDFPHEDWVSSVSCQMQGQFLTASYDGHIRTFDYSKNITSTTQAHTAPITSVCLVPSTDTTLIASASHDLTGRLMQLTSDDDSTTYSTKLSAKPLATLHLHAAPLSSVACNSTGSHLLTASWDTLIGLWDTTIPSTDEVPEVMTVRDRKKRRKLEVGADAGNVNGIRVKRKMPLLVLKSHTARVSKAVFGSSGSDHTKAYSCSFDSTVRVWDTENGLCTQTIAASEKPFLDLAVSPDGPTAFATSTDRTLTVYDLRSSTSSLTSSGVGSFLHPATPSCLALGPPGSHQLVSGAYDGTMRLWDLRTVRGGSNALVSFKVWDKKKILAVDWARGNIVGVGGEGGFEVWKVGSKKKSPAV